MTATQKIGVAIGEAQDLRLGGLSQGYKAARRPKVVEHRRAQDEAEIDALEAWLLSQ
jgi:hypothetical protein